MIWLSRPVGDGYLSPRDVEALAGILGQFNEGGHVRSSVRSQSFPNRNSAGTAGAP